MADKSDDMFHALRELYQSMTNVGESDGERIENALLQARKVLIREQQRRFGVGS